jgi:cobalt-precorrin 5A hydrolase
MITYRSELTNMIRHAKVKNNISLAAARQASLRATTSSPRVMALFGFPSIAEAAAPAGAGPSSILLVARMSEGGASCAIAGNRDP